MIEYSLHEQGTVKKISCFCDGTGEEDYDETEAYEVRSVAHRASPREQECARLFLRRGWSGVRYVINALMDIYSVRQPRDIGPDRALLEKLLVELSELGHYAQALIRNRNLNAQEEDAIQQCAAKLIHFCQNESVVVESPRTFVKTCLRYCVFDLSRKSVSEARHFEAVDIPLEEMPSPPIQVRIKAEELVEKLRSRVSVDARMVLEMFLEKKP